ncbi:hypothetical protein KL86DPRO_20542 [uncultured delta proteobacterium]|uniref:ORC1/DEAH AAA+ ATPase domain-containing protein n=1 Tax=uncultured delta proteobacterium TaxID=34034 RepID=A0A212K261_9DELT|nr:hypothetical protein KL86DPRO_20542 [uncultured delta proteobacterium]
MILLAMHKPLPAGNTAAHYFTPRLREAFAAASACPLTVVEAPMGYGKTVAVREFLQKGRARVVWTPILGPSADACWRTFCHELERCAPETADAAESLLRLGFPYDSVRADAALDILSQAGFATPAVLVFDDCHHLPAQESGKALARFCELLAQSGIPKLRMVCVSRDAWDGDGSELLGLKGMLASIGRGAFTLTPPEIREYYASCGVSLAQDDADALHAAPAAGSAPCICTACVTARAAFFRGPRVSTGRSSRPWWKRRSTRRFPRL